MIDPQIKAEIRNWIVKANLCLHRGQVDGLNDALKQAQYISGSLEIEEAVQRQLMYG